MARRQTFRYEGEKLWWFAEGPADDPLASDLPALHRNRERVLQVATLIVPGHGAPFTPDESTPR